MVAQKMRPNCSSTSLLPLLPVDCATENPGEELTLMRPYKHQVGGHTVIFSVDDEHVCKPRNVGESRFYQNVPEELKPWTAKYCFEAEVRLRDYNFSTFVLFSVMNEYCLALLR